MAPYSVRSPTSDVVRKEVIQIKTKKIGIIVMEYFEVKLVTPRPLVQVKIKRKIRGAKRPFGKAKRPHGVLCKKKGRANFAS